MRLERTTALALVDAGYMPLSEYIEMFAANIAAEALPEAPERDSLAGPATPELAQQAAA